MERTKDVAGYVFLACTVGTSVNALFNVTSLAYAGSVAWPDLFSAMLGWWVPNALAALVVAPVILAWANPDSLRWSRRLVAEAALCGTGLVVTTFLSFNSWYVYGVQNYALAYLPYPFLVWSALRFGQRGATTGTLAVSVLAIGSLLEGRGPFVLPAESDSLKLIGCYISLLGVTNMLLAAAAAERRTAELALMESERRYRGMVEDQTDLICRFTAQGELNFANAAYCRFQGKTKEQLLGTNFFATLNSGDADIPLAHFLSLTPEEPVLCFDQRVTGPNGELSWQQCAVRRLGFQPGATQEFQAVIQDITSRKRAEAELERARDVAESASRAKSQFLASMSHELRTPLNGIIGFSEVLADQTFGPLNQRQLQYVNHVLGSGRHLLELINDILDLSKVEAGRLELSPARLELGPLLQNSLAIVKTAAQRKNLLLICQPPPGLPAVFADEAKLKQILYNLLSNAVKFTRDGGRITLSVADHPEGSEPCMEIAVADSGIGVRPEDQRRIFHEFEQVDSSYARQQQGTGLGLALTKRLVELHGGRIWVESEGVEGRGSIFKFTLRQPKPGSLLEGLVREEELVPI
jgi:PAS domain S-box-containing protein